MRWWGRGSRMAIEQDSEGRVPRVAPAKVLAAHHVARRQIAPVVPVVVLPPPLGRVLYRAFALRTVPRRAHETRCDSDHSTDPLDQELRVVPDVLGEVLALGGSGHQVRPDLINRGAAVFVQAPAEEFYPHQLLLGVEAYG